MLLANHLGLVVLVKITLHNLVVDLCDVVVAVVAEVAEVHRMVVEVAVVAAVVDFVVAINNRKTFNICVHILFSLYMFVFVCVYISI